MKNLLKNSIEELKINIDINKYIVEQFMKYKKELIKWNKNMNLTSIIDDKEIILKHFIDSISLLTISYLQKDELKIIDIGTGAGFPGLPLKIIRPDYKLTLLDSLNKRIKFINHIISILNLENVETIHMRAEDAGKDVILREKFDVGVSRAVANMKILCEFVLPFINIGGKFIALKGPKIKEELFDAKKQINTLGGEIEDIKYIKIPYTNIVHSLVIINKKNHTETKYPRKLSKII